MAVSIWFVQATLQNNDKKTVCQWVFDKGAIYQWKVHERFPVSAKMVYKRLRGIAGYGPQGGDSPYNPPPPRYRKSHAELFDI